MISIPTLTLVDVIFGKIEHLPAWDDIPAEFKHHNNLYCEFVSDWFFNGLTEADMARLTPREDIERGPAFAAVKAILASWEPKHEHKEAGAAYLLSEWFSLTEEPPR